MSDEALRRQRETIERGLRRANTFGLGIIGVVICLAALAIHLALRSARHADLAEAERAQAERRLVESTLAEVRAQRLAGRMGQRTRSLAGLKTAARLASSPVLREEAVATLALPDLEDTDPWQPLPPGASAIVVDASLEHFAAVQHQTNIIAWTRSPLSPQFSTSRADWRDPAIRLSFDGHHLAAWTPRFLGVWDTRDGTTRLEWSAEAGRLIRAVAWAPASDVIAVTDSTDAVRVRDLASGTWVAEWNKLTNGWNLAFHPAEPWIAVECSESIQVRDWHTGRSVRQLRIENRGIASLTWTTDGTRLAIAGFDRVTQVWDLATDRVVRLEGHTRELVRTYFHPSGEWLASFSWDNTLRLWDTAAGNQVLQTTGVIPLGFSQDGARLAVWRPSRGIGFYRLHTPRSYRSLFPPAEQGRHAWSLDIDPESRALLAASDSGFWIADLETGRLAAQGRVDGCRGAYFMPGGTVVTAGAGGLRYWRPPPADGITREWSVADHPQASQRGVRLGLSAVDRSRQRLVAHVDDAGFGVIHDLRHGHVLHELRGQPDFSAPEFSADGRWIASGCWNPTVTKPMFAALWDANTGVLLRQFPTTKCSVTFSPDNRYLLLGAAREYRLLATDTWSLLRVFERADGLFDYGQATFAPDGNLVALHISDRTVGLCDPHTGHELARLNSPGQRILRRLRFSPNGRWLVVGTETDVQLWHLPRLREELASLGLDWGSASSSVGHAPGTVPPVLALASAVGRRAHGVPWEILGILSGMVLVIGMTLWLRYHQRIILDRYRAVELLTTQRSEELERAQRELVHSQKMRALGTLAAGIAHDFNNLLSVIRMAAGLIARRAAGDAEIVENTREIEHAVQQGKGVVRSMLGYSREATDPPASFSLPELVEDTVGMLSKEFLSGIVLTLELDRGVFEVCATRSRVEQALLNLVVNAAEAMEGHGRLTIAVAPVHRPPERWVISPRDGASLVELKVGDSGPGIDPEALPRIFEPFFTTKNTGAARGTGLGLALVYTVARDEGLGLCVATRPGAGAEFGLYLPTTPPVRQKHTDLELPAS